jgi:hypothetical protein
MKQKFLIAFCVFGFGTCHSQQISADLISVSGQHDANNVNQLTWIIGETLTETISDTSVILASGLFQSNLNITSVSNDKINGLKVDIYPNPTIDILNIVFENIENQEMQYTLADIQGKTILSGIIKNKEYQKQIDFSNLTIGTYLLNFSGKENSQTYKIIKK